MAYLMPVPSPICDIFTRAAFRAFATLSPIIACSEMANTCTAEEMAHDEQPG
jgi:hypothetical protein